MSRNKCDSSVLLQVVVVVCCFVTSADASTTTREYRTLSGSGNNVANPTWGTPNTPYLYVQGAPSYANVQTGTMRTDLPNPRLISNMVCSQNPEFTSHQTSDALFYWGQFTVHGILLSGSSTVSANIPVPMCDPVFDLACSGTVVIPFVRTTFDTSSGSYRVLNALTAFVDGAAIYGVDDVRGMALRTGQYGLLASQTGANNDILLPNLGTNAGTFAEAGSAGSSLFFTGDVRGNENPLISCYTTLFVREHNRKATELRTTLATTDDTTLYQEARVWVIALLQQITYNEYLPQRLGNPLPLYAGYDPTVNPGIDIFFMAAAMRYGHTATNTILLRLDENRNPIPDGHLLLRDAFFNPAPIKTDGIEPFLRGITIQPEQALDSRVVPDLRNFLFGSPTVPQDLMSINIQRGRDHGAPLYNDARVALGLSRITSWANFPGTPGDITLLSGLYGSVDLVDPIIGGNAELPTGTSTMGPTYTASLTEQFTRIRSGDRFWYEIPGVLRTPDDLAEIYKTKLSAVVLRNTNIAAMPDNMFRTNQPLVLAVNAGAATSSTTLSPYGCIASTIATMQCMSVIATGVTLHWSIPTDASTVTLALQVVGSPGWIGLGVTPSGMLGANAVIATGASGASPAIHSYNLNARATSGVVLDPNQVITNAAVTSSGGTTILTYTRTSNNGGSNTLNIQGTNNLVYAYSDSTTLAYHSSSRGVISWSSTGAVSILTPDPYTAHGVLMSTAWGVMLPLGMFSARFLKKVEPTDGPTAFWFVTHMATQLLGFGAAVVGWIIALNDFDHGQLTTAHGVLGMIVMCMGTLQVTNGLLRPKHGASFRPIWEKFHHILGRLALLLAMPTIYLGLQYVEVYVGNNVSIWGTIIYTIVLTAETLTFIILSRIQNPMRHMLISPRTIVSPSTYFSPRADTTSPKPPSPSEPAPAPAQAPPAPPAATDPAPPAPAPAPVPQFQSDLRVHDEIYPQVWRAVA